MCACLESRENVLGRTSQLACLEAHSTVGLKIEIGGAHHLVRILIVEDTVSDLVVQAV